MKTKTTIIGCGVSGLTTGIVLLEAGYKVHIISKEMPKYTTSAKAAAIWFPFKIEPQKLANSWSETAYKKFLALSRESNSGVSMIWFTVCITKEADAWWKAALPKENLAETLQKAKPDVLPKEMPLGYRIKVPLIETPIYLDFLLSTFKKLGGKITKEKVTDLSKLCAENDYVVNCTGLDARELVGDKSLYPIQGQIVKIPPQSIPTGWDADKLPGTLGHEIAYVIPRRDCIVLGGTVVKDAESLLPDEAVTQGIIDRCKRIAPGLSFDRNAVKAIVGLRPGRPTVRLERVGNLIHNYGHGGAGFTVSWGCAEAVLGLVENA